MLQTLASDSPFSFSYSLSFSFRLSTLLFPFPMFPFRQTKSSENWRRCFFPGSLFERLDVFIRCESPRPSRGRTKVEPKEN